MAKVVNIIIVFDHNYYRVDQNELNPPHERLGNNITNPPERRAIGNSDIPLHTGGYIGQKLLPTTNFFVWNMNIENTKDTAYFKGMYIYRVNTQCISTFQTII